MVLSLALSDLDDSAYGRGSNEEVDAAGSSSS